MKTVHAMTLGIALALTSVAAAAQATHEHSQATAGPAQPMAHPGPAAQAGPPAHGKGMATGMDGMSCDHEMHEKMMKRMEHMEAMMEKMHGTAAVDPGTDAKPASDPGKHEHH